MFLLQESMVYESVSRRQKEAASVKVIDTAAVDGVLTQLGQQVI